MGLENASVAKVQGIDCQCDVTLARITRHGGATRGRDKENCTLSQEALEHLGVFFVLGMMEGRSPMRSNIIIMSGRTSQMRNS